MSSQERLNAPHLLDVEVTQTLRRLVLLSEIEAGRARSALDDYLSMPVERHAHAELLPRMWELRQTLTAYDAAYIALAEGLAARLLTCDARLARAPGYRATVQLI
jgi:predicted nucleic acid-binding protein